MGSVIFQIREAIGAPFHRLNTLLPHPCLASKGILGDRGTTNIDVSTRYDFRHRVDKEEILNFRKWKEIEN
jgi:hypothetical protein